MVREHAVELLRHRAVERTHAGLDVRDRDARLRRGQRAGQCGVRVAVDQDAVRPALGEQRGDRREHPRGLLGVRPAVDAQLQLRARDAELAHEDRRKLVVVVLAGVDEQLVVALAQQARHRRRLDELRAVPDDRDDVHLRH